MPAPLVLALTPDQTQELEHVRDHDPAPYPRERAAGILKVGAGHSQRAVARSGLLKPRRRETVPAWVQRYLAEGVAGLRVRPGRGRKPAFPPSGDGAGADRVD